MKMKKVLAVVLAFALTVTATIGGTVAYLTQKVDPKTNTFTVGGLDVTLSETTDVITNDGGKVEDRTDGADYTELMPGDKIVKKVTVSNNDKTEGAYVKVVVTLKNDKNDFALLLNKAIDDVYGDADAQRWYDRVFDGWGMNHGKDLDNNGTDDAGMRLTITGDKMPEYVLQVDSVKTIHEYWQQYNGNWFKDEDTVIPYDGYHTTGMNDYELRYVYYIDLPAGESTTLFNGFNIPMEFNVDQLAMFDGLVVDIQADAVQKANFANARSAFMSLAEGDGTTVVVPMWKDFANTSWYNDNVTEFVLSTPDQVAGLAMLVDEGKTFEGKTVKLANDIDLTGSIFDPVGSYRKDSPFKGTFDGQGHTILGLSQNTWALDNGYYYGDLGLGFFGKVEDATVKNVTFDGVEISGESALCGTVAATAYGDCTFENITVKNAKVNDYQYYAGGIVGWASGDHEYINCNVDSSTTIGSQWGDFGNASGGVIGGIGSDAVIKIKDCNVACRIDAVNDVVSAYQWYCYRNCGMLIGRVPQTIVNGEAQTVKTPENVTCENVTVTYGDWANYTYCEFAGTGYPYVRVQAGTSVDAYSNVRYGHPTDANGNLVVDDNHVHNEGEDHNLLIAFDQLFGGPANDRYAYYGIPAFNGVKVVYDMTLPVATADELIETLEAKKGVELQDDVKIDPAGMSNAYGTTGINVKNGQTIDGNGHTLDIKGAGGTWDSGINTTGGLIKDITVTGSFRGIFINHNSTHSERVVLENVTIDGTTYTISCDQGMNQGLTATDSTFNGWTSYAATLGDAKFVDCYFGEGSGYAYCRPYAPTEFVNCEFEAGYTLEPRAAVTLENCTLDGVALTNANIADLVTDTSKVTVK